MKVKFFILFLLFVTLANCAGKSSISTRPGFDRGHRSAAVSPGKTFTGDASFYGPGFAGKQTANGEIFDPQEMTCAHKTLPFNTRLKVTRKDNGKSVVVRVNDRGPYAQNRILDLSVAAAQKLDMERVGHAEVTAEVLP